MSPARRDLNQITIPRFSQYINGGSKVLFVGVDSVWDYRYLFENCTYETMDIRKNGNPDILGDIQNCPEIPDNSYDGVIMTGVYEYLSTPAKAIAEIYRILNDDGVFLFCAPGIAYYGNQKPTITFRRISDVLPQFTIKEVFISHYTSKDPYYFHITAIK